jgi:hypothetical protein
MTQTQRTIQPINNLKSYTVHTILSRPCMPCSEQALEFAEESAKIETRRKTNSIPAKYPTNSPVQEGKERFGLRMPSLVGGCPMKPKLAPIDDDDEFDFSDIPNSTYTLGVGSPKIELSTEANSQESPLDFTFSHGNALIEDTSLDGTANFLPDSASPINATRAAIESLKGTFQLDTNKLESIKARLNRTDNNTVQEDLSQLLKLPESDPKRQMAESILDRSRMSRRFEIAKKMLAMVGENLKNNK